MRNMRGGDARDYIGARLTRLASNPEKSGLGSIRPSPSRPRRWEEDGRGARHCQVGPAVSEPRQRGAPARPRAGWAEEREKWARARGREGEKKEQDGGEGELGLGLDPRGFLFFFLFILPFSILFSYPHIDYL